MNEWTCLCTKHPPSEEGLAFALWKSEKVLLWHAVSLLSLHQARLVRVQDSERRVELECCEERGAKPVLLVHKPNYRRDSQDSHHAENDQGGEQRAGF